MCTRYEDIYFCYRDDFSLYLTILIRDVNSNNIVYIFLFVIFWKESKMDRICERELQRE